MISDTPFIFGFQFAYIFHGTYFCSIRLLQNSSLNLELRCDTILSGKPGCFEIFSKKELRTLIALSVLLIKMKCTLLDSQSGQIVPASNPCFVLGWPTMKTVLIDMISIQASQSLQDSVTFPGYTAQAVDNSHTHPHNAFHIGALCL